MYQKRECNIDFDLSFGGFEGTQNCEFTINGDKHKYWFSFAMGDLFGHFLDIVYRLYIEANDPYTDHSIKYETNDPDNPHHITDIIGQTMWDSEGGNLEWTLSRALYNNDAKTIKITLDYEFGERVYNYEVSLDDLLYATAKALTKLLKQSGICGYHYSSEHDYINMVNFLIVKYLALTGEMPDMKEQNTGMGVVFTSMEEEISLLLFDM